MEAGLRSQRCCGKLNSGHITSTDVRNVNGYYMLGYTLRARCLSALIQPSAQAGGELISEATEPKVCNILVL